MQFSFTTILATLAMATTARAQYTFCVDPSLIGGACGGDYPVQCEDPSPYQGFPPTIRCCIPALNC
ncbi:hypothetical protein F5Y18DRAFT_410907 [Xylariaceae sp. FL1019]|nr:hypothetical protein F5Y18DRAFT_410907 [Xylariaceae sp. FL1019]